MIKLKSLLFEQEEKQKIHKLVSNWKNKKAKEYASVLIEKYGGDGEKYNFFKRFNLLNFSFFYDIKSKLNR